MKVRLLTIGKTSSSSLKELEAIYEKRLVHYVNYERFDLSDIKNSSSLSQEQLKEKEGQVFLSKINSDEFLILLDEKGSSYSSEQFAKMIGDLGIGRNKCLTFCVGGAFGFSTALYARANAKISLSSMTFSHQMVRTIFLEQLYRAYTILKGEKYHHS